MKQRKNIPLFCDNCNDIVKAVRPVKVVLWNKTEIPLNICLDCVDKGSIEIPLKRKLLVVRIKDRFRKRLK